MATIKIKARSLGTDGVARRFIAAVTRMPRDTMDAQRELGKLSEVVFASHAPFRSGRLIRGISSSGAGTVIVKDEARNPQTGYDYVGVTRFGHGKIIAGRGRAPAFTLATKKSRGFLGGKRKPMLRFVIGGRVVYTPYVNAWRPASDWAEDALPEVEAQAQVVASRLGQTIESHF